LKLAKLKCKEDVIIYGRNKNGEPDKCFKKGNEYLFCVDEIKHNIFTFNDVKEIHSLGLDDYYTDKYFEVLTIDESDNFGLDEFSLNRMERLYKDRKNFQD
jgi:hypothetical protein